jgi:hypothetical protein
MLRCIAEVKEDIQVSVDLIKERTPMRTCYYSNKKVHGKSFVVVTLVSSSKVEICWQTFGVDVRTKTKLGLG